MARVKVFDKKSVDNRNRVRKHRQNKKLLIGYNNYIKNKIENKKIVCNPNDNGKVYIQNEHYNDENSFDNAIDRANEFKNKLRFWAIKHRITKSALNDLLVILIFAGLSFLPKDSRTLMCTPLKVPIETLTNGKLFYYGIENCLRDIFRKIEKNISFTLDLNFDGFPISKSSANQFWPILASMRGMNLNAHAQFWHLS